MLRVYDTELRSRLMLGTSRYPSPAVLAEAVKASRMRHADVTKKRARSTAHVEPGRAPARSG